MSSYSIREAAQLLDVSDDTVRRWVDAGELRRTSVSGPQRVDGVSLAELAQRRAEQHEPPAGGSRQSARNRFGGLVTRVTTDTVMAQVELQCGPYRVVSLMSAEAVHDLGLEPGVRAVASVKSTNVVVEVP